MQKQRLFLITGILLALAAVFMIKVYLDKERQVTEENAQKRFERIQANQTPVLIAKKDILKGTIIESGGDLVEIKIIPNQFVEPQALTSLDRISGMMAIVPISKNQQITSNKLAWPKDAGGGSLAMSTPPGKRAITISVDNISSLAGMLKPEDYVDVIAMLPQAVQGADGKQATQLLVLPLFQKVLVLAVGNESRAYIQEESRYKKTEQKEKETAPLITLALNPQEASLIAFVQEQGKIRLILRSPSDTNIEPAQPATWETLFQYIMPQKSAEEQQQVDAGPFVEIYRGLNKEKVPLSDK